MTFWVTERNLIIKPFLTDHIGELCERSHSFLPRYRKIEGAEVVSKNERNLECIVTFQTNSILQRFMLRFEVLKLDCNDHLYIFDGEHADSTSAHKADISCRNTKQTLGTLFTRTNFVTLKYVTDGWGTDNSFKLVITAIKDGSKNAWWILKYNALLPPPILFAHPHPLPDEIYANNLCPSDFLTSFFALSLCRTFLPEFSLYHEGILYPSRSAMW